MHETRAMFYWGIGWNIQSPPVVYVQDKGGTSSASLVVVDCNDRLYGHDSKYLAEVDKMADTLLEEILNQLKLLDRPEVNCTNYM